MSAVTAGEKVTLKVWRTIDPHNGRRLSHPELELSQPFEGFDGLDRAYDRASTYGAGYNWHIENSSGQVVDARGDML